MNTNETNPDDLNGIESYFIQMMMRKRKRFHPKKSLLKHFLSRGINTKMTNLIKKFVIFFSSRIFVSIDDIMSFCRLVNNDYPNEIFEVLRMLKIVKQLTEWSDIDGKDGEIYIICNGLRDNNTVAGVSSGNSFHGVDNLHVCNDVTEYESNNTDYSYSNSGSSNETNEHNRQISAPVEVNNRTTTIDEYTTGVIEMTNFPNLNNKCYECGNKVGNFKKHYKGRNHPNFNLKCNLCEFYSSTRCSLKAHLRIHRKEAPFICPDCGIVFLTMSGLNFHMKHGCFYLHKICKLKCLLCFHVDVDNLLSFHKHLRERHYVKLFECSSCDIGYPTLKDVRRHLNRFHGTHRFVSGFRCDLCPHTLHVGSDALQHVCFHTLENTKIYYVYLCVLCKSFTANTLENYHLHRKQCYIDRSSSILCNNSPGSYYNDNNNNDNNNRRRESQLNDGKGECDQNCYISLPSLLLRTPFAQNTITATTKPVGKLINDDKGEDENNYDKKVELLKMNQEQNVIDVEKKELSKCSKDDSHADNDDDDDKKKRPVNMNDDRENSKLNMKDDDKEKVLLKMNDDDKYADNDDDESETYLITNKGQNVIDVEKKELLKWNEDDGRADNDDKKKRRINVTDDGENSKQLNMDDKEKVPFKMNDDDKYADTDDDKNKIYLITNEGVIDVEKKELLKWNKDDSHAGNDDDKEKRRLTMNDDRKKMKKLYTKDDDKENVLLKMNDYNANNDDDRNKTHLIMNEDVIDDKKKELLKRNKHDEPLKWNKDDKDADNVDDKKKVGLNMDDDNDKKRKQLNMDEDDNNDKKKRQLKMKENEEDNDDKNKKRIFKKMNNSTDNYNDNKKKWKPLKMSNYEDDNINNRKRKQILIINKEDNDNCDRKRKTLQIADDDEEDVGNDDNQIKRLLKISENDYKNSRQSVYECRECFSLSKYSITTPNKDKRCARCDSYKTSLIEEHNYSSLLENIHH